MKTLPMSDNLALSDMLGGHRATSYKNSASASWYRARGFALTLTTVCGGWDLILPPESAVTGWQAPA